LAVDSALAVAAGQKVEPTQVSEAVLTTCDNAAEFVANHP
jgi:ribose transport system substrate-binding protein